MPDTDAVIGKNVKLSSNKYKRTGYNFLGWSLEKDGDVTYKNSASVKDLSYINLDTVTLYAVWSPVSYKISYAGLNKSDIHNNPLSYNAEMDDIVLSEPQRYGYTFVGFYLDKKYTQKIDTFDTSLGKNITIYCLFRPNSYTISFDPNGGEGTMEDQLYSFNSKKALQANSFTFKGYKFTGWEYEERIIPDKYKGNLTDQDGTNIVLKACWEAINYKISYTGVTKSDAVSYTHLRAHET